MLGSTPDISAYVMFDWYQLVWYHEPKAQFPYEKKVMGRWIGTADTCTDLMAYSIVDVEGHSFSVIKEIVDHRKNGHALLKDDGFIIMKSGQQKLKCTTQGWDHLFKLGDGMTAWIPLKDLKESMPVQVAEYTIGNKIAEEPAYAWWIQDVLRCRDHIISKVKSQYWK